MRVPRCKQGCLLAGPGLPAFNASRLHERTKWRTGNSRTTQSLANRRGTEKTMQVELARRCWRWRAADGVVAMFGFLVKKEDQHSSEPEDHDAGGNGLRFVPLAADPQLR